MPVPSEPRPLQGSPARRQSSITTSKPRLKMNSNTEMRSRTGSLNTTPTSRRSSSLARDESRRNTDLLSSKVNQQQDMKVIEKLEALALKHENLLVRHENLIAKCEALESQHGNMIIKHAEVLDVLTQLIEKMPRQDSSISPQPSPIIKPQSFKIKIQRETSDTSPSIKPQSSSTLPKPPSWNIKQPQTSNSPSRRSSAMTDRRDTKSLTRGSQRKSTTNNHTPGSDHGLRVCIRKRPANEEESDCVECVENQVSHPHHCYQCYHCLSFY